jgi:predicted transcriptional regulator
MLDVLISSKTRIKLLLKFFLNNNNTSYLRGLESELSESSNAIRIELNRLEKAGLLHSFNQGNKKYFQANTEHPLYEEIHGILRKHIGLDTIVDQVVDRLGNLQAVYITGDLAIGKDSDIIDLILIGGINKEYLVKLIEKAETIITRKLRYIIFENQDAYQTWLDKDSKPTVFLWSKDLG